MNEPTLSTSSALPAITPLGYIDHSEYGDKGVKLVYGERDDGSLVRVETLEYGQRLHLVCPVCRKEVHRARSKNARLFFRHASGAPGCGGPETNAHIWAKDQLLQAKEVWLPAVLSAFPGVNTPLQEAQAFRFVDVLVEPTRGDLRPDLAVVVTTPGGKTRELWIEIHVTHRCGKAKIAKINARAQATIEIDLSEFRTSHDAPAIRKALLEGKDNRVWLFHKAIAEDFETRTQKLEDEKARARAATREKAQRLVTASRSARVAAPSPDVAAVVAKVRELGLADIVGLSSRRSGFTVSSLVWQAVIWNTLVVSRQEAERPNPPLNPTVALNALSGCLPSTLRHIISPEVLQAAREIDPDFVAPQEAIADYFETLGRRRDLWQGRTDDWYVGHERSTAIHRRIEHFREVRQRLVRVTQRVKDLLALLPEPPNFDMGDWLDRPCLEGRTPRQMIEGRDEHWDDLDAPLQAIERMAAGWRPVDELLGLPVSPLKAAAEEREREAQAAAARRKEEAERKASQDRVEALEQEARARLGRVADAWLAEPVAGDLTALKLAAQSPAGMQRARDALWTRVREIELEAERERRWTRNLAELGRQVFKRFDDVMGQVWINGPHPKLGGSSPKEAVREDAGLKASLELLPRKRQRSGH